jgi:hypothetical protein
MGMANQKKEGLLRVPRTGPAECNDCGQKFTGTSLDEVLLKFREHTCTKDFSQTAARIVKQATEGH